MTSDLANRIEAHRSGSVDGLTKQYGVHTLVYFEVHADMYEASGKTCLRRLSVLLNPAPD